MFFGFVKLFIIDHMLGVVTLRAYYEVELFLTVFNVFNLSPPFNTEVTGVCNHVQEGRNSGKAGLYVVQTN